MKHLIVFELPILAAFFPVLVDCETKHHILRYVPFYCFGARFICALIAFLAEPGFFTGGNVIAAVIGEMIGSAS